MAEPLLFVCTREPSLRGGASPPPSFVSVKNPIGRAFVAFASQELAAAVVVFFRRAANVYLVSESQLTPELVGSITRHRVLVYRTADDYDGATANAPDFAWAEHMIDYDFAGALARVLPGSLREGSA
jgi:hypothetical protein